MSLLYTPSNPSCESATFRSIVCSTACVPSYVLVIASLPSLSILTVRFATFIVIAFDCTASFSTVIFLPLSVEFINTVPSVGSVVLRVKPRVCQSISLYLMFSFFESSAYVTVTDKSFKTRVSPYL
ncbi:unknown [Firmicutes bacterium CAG:41]|nr:unknown [Firmicutes bacterium CAG:41]